MVYVCVCVYVGDLELIDVPEHVGKAGEALTIPYARTACNDPN